MKSSRRVRSVVFTAVFFLAAEAGLRLRAPEETRGDFSHDGPVVLLLGSSRTEFGLKPRVAEAALADAGVEGAWVADVTHRALTMIGMLRLYREKLRPVVEGGDLDGWIGIEIRGSGMNDSYRVFDEPEYLARCGYDPEGGTIGDAESGDTPLDLLLGGRFGAGARALVGGLALVRERPTLKRWLDPTTWFDGDGAEGASAPRGSWEAHLRALDVPWATGEKGWQVFHRQRREDLNAKVERRRFRRHHLKDYAIGGVQTACVRELLAEARADGLKPFLYVMPITAVHRRFFEPGDYAAFRRLAERIAAEEGVPLFDLDRGHALPNAAFLDTGHLHHTAAAGFTRTFVERVLLPLLGR